MNISIVENIRKEWYGNVDKFYHLVFLNYVYKFVSKHINLCLLESYECM